MDYTLSGIRNRVLNDKLDDPTFDPDIVDRFINDAQRAIFNQYELSFMEDTYTTTVAQGDLTVTLPIDYQLIQALMVTAPTANRRDITDSYMSFRDFHRAYPVPSADSQSRPSIWTLRGETLYLAYPADQTYTMEVDYLKTPVLLTDDADIPELPQEWEELLVLGAYIRILDRNEDFDLASYYKNGDYTQELDKLEARIGRRQAGTMPIMSQPLRSTRGRRTGGRH